MGFITIKKRRRVVVAYTSTFTSDFEDRFTTAAPSLGATRAAEPTGTWNVSTGAQLAVVASDPGYLEALAFTAAGDPNLVSQSSYARTTGVTLGRTIRFRFRMPASTGGVRCSIGFYTTADPGANPSIGVADSGGTARLYAGAGNFSLINLLNEWYSTMTNEWIDMVCLLSGTADAGSRVWVIVSGVAYLVYWDNLGTSNTFYFGTCARLTDYDIQVDRYVSGTLTGTLNALHGAATLNQASPVSGTEYAGTLQMITEAAITVPGTTAGKTFSLKYNIVDANNYYAAEIIRNAGDTNWDCQLTKYTAGVGAAMHTLVTAIGTPTRLRVMRVGNRHLLFTGTASAITERGTVATDSTYSGTNVAIVSPVGGSSSTLISHPVTDSDYDVIPTF